MARRTSYKILCVISLLCATLFYLYNTESGQSIQWTNISNWISTGYNNLNSLLGKGKSENDNILKLDDIFITVKTSEKFHKTRVAIILKTWWNYAKEQTYFFTDADDEDLTNITEGHSINTKCGDLHKPEHLCCKMGKEYDAYYDSGKKWWCHFDDDNYVNVDLLVKVLREYNWTTDLYLGRASYTHAIKTNYLGEKVSYWFATGGAGVCISRPLSEKMTNWTRNGAFVKTCHNLGQADDCTIGFIITSKLGQKFTERKDFNSHIQNLRTLPAENLTSQVVLSYRHPWNYIHHSPSPLLLSEKDDPTRLLSHHCLIYPDTRWCPKNETKTKL